MKSIFFVMGLHNHQPVGNFDHVFEEAYQHSYLPLLQTLMEYPALRMMYHTTGPLYDWLEGHHPEYFDLLKVLIDRNQLEVMTSPYEEPILAIIPDRDKCGQITKMSRYLTERLGAKAQGLWMAERVWEPHLARPLAECGVKYITLDDYHFQGAGMSPDELLGYYQTDEQGHSLSIFPINQKLRYLIPFSPPEEAINYLRSRANESGRNLLVMADDGEKFGLWPGTYEWVYQKGWMRQFFTLLREAMTEGWLKMVTFSQFMEANPPRGRVYLPTASYFEMSTWSLPPQSGATFEHLIHQFQDQGRMDELKPYLKGGIWRNFLAKYDESNRMYRKMLWVSDRLARAETLLKPDQEEEHQTLAHARDRLFKGQCNCAYWHGVFGGLYLPHLRHAIYQNLIEAEDHINRITNPDGGFTEILVSDLNADGSDEVYLRNHRVGLIFSLREGGTATEFDYIPARFNLLNTLRRQQEAYHENVHKAGTEIEQGQSIHDQFLTKEIGLERFLVYDRHLRGSFIDHFFSAQESPEALREGRYYELGDFVGGPYELTESDTTTGRIRLERHGRVVDNEVIVVKIIETLPAEAGVQVEYRVINRSSFPLTIAFAPEFNFALLGGNYTDKYYYRIEGESERQPLNSMGQSENNRRFSLYDENDGFAVHLDFEEPARVWRYPVETVSMSEAGFERVYQSSCVLPVWNLEVEPEKVFVAKFRIVVEKLKTEG
ncbi:MAG: DUF1926 domain-containing protein [Candidatus Zixiibacteriota bacterium]|nr:MAG: DUF1926 domain-containing protein [candidate division Zixibacteria bacterium]